MRPPNANCARCQVRIAVPGAAKRAEEILVTSHGLCRDIEGEPLAGHPSSHGSTIRDFLIRDSVNNWLRR
jgi:hypothetical protein